MPQEVKKYSISELNELVSRIRRGNFMSEEEISVAAGRNPGYISQCRSRGVVPAKFYQTLVLTFKAALDFEEKKATDPASGPGIYNPDRVKKRALGEDDIRDKYIALLEKVNASSSNEVKELIETNRALVTTLRETQVEEFEQPYNKSENQMRNGAGSEAIDVDSLSKLLEDAGALLETGHTTPVAAIVMFVLEKYLSKLYNKYSYKFQEKIDQGEVQLNYRLLNEVLYKNRIYDSQTEHSISNWLNLRNSFAHGNHVKYSKAQIKEMLYGLLGIITTFN